MKSARTAGLNTTLDLSHGPRVLMADVTASMDQETIQMQSARVTLGKTNLEASGNLKEANGGGAATSTRRSTWANSDDCCAWPPGPTGRSNWAARLRLDAQNNYYLAGNYGGAAGGFPRWDDADFQREPGFERAGRRSRRIALANLRLGALGGRFTGAASLAGDVGISTRWTSAEFRY